MKTKWGILGTGNIAKRMAKAITESGSSELFAVASRSADSAGKFGDEFKVPVRYASYEALLADKNVTAVYISLPNHLHGEWTVKCAQAGKHILCEKPFTVNHAEAVKVLEVVKSNKVFFMEAFMYRCHPQTHQVLELLKQKAIGEVRLIKASFCFDIGPDYQNIRLSRASAGGAIMDVGCYTVSFARLIAGAAAGKEFAEPVSFRALAHIGTTSQVDEVATANLYFPGGILANLSCATQVLMDKTLSILGSEGSLLIPMPWIPKNDQPMLLTKKGEKSATALIHPVKEHGYNMQIDLVAKCIAENKTQAPFPAMTWDDTLGNMKALDAWRKEIGLTFADE